MGPNNDADRAPRAWVFYAKAQKSDRTDPSWKLEPGAVNFWWHGKGEYKRSGGPPYSKTMKRGDEVVMIVGDEIVALGRLIGGADWKFVDRQGRRRWPLLIENVPAKPISRSFIEAGERIIPYAGTVCPLPPKPWDRLRSVLFGREQPLPFAKARSKQA
jgi:hypothetical protein